MKRRRKVHKETEGKTYSKGTKRISMECFFCRSPVMTDEKSRAILCSRCTARLAGTPLEINKYPKREVDMTDIVKTRKPRKPNGTPAVVKPTAGYGRGWHLRKEFISPDGKRYEFGKLVEVTTK